MLIVFEGIDGCGKTTVIQRLQAVLTERKYDVIVTSEFNKDQPETADLREELMTRKKDPLGQYHTVLKARDHHYLKVLKPAEKAGKIILMDRYLMSTIAYQGQNAETPARRIMDDHEMFEFPVADLTVLLTCSPSTAMKRRRAAGKTDAFDDAGRDFFYRAHEIYRSCASAIQRQRPGRIAVIDAERPIDDVMHDVVNAVSGLIMVEAA